MLYPIFITYYCVIKKYCTYLGNFLMNMSVQVQKQGCTWLHNTPPHQKKKEKEKMRAILTGIK